MNRTPATAAAVLALTILSFFQFPGHTWLQQDSQIWVPILEHHYDPSVLRNDAVAVHSHTAYTLYDDIARSLQAAVPFGSDAGFREVLMVHQFVTRALGIWGVYLMAAAAGLAFEPALLVTAIVSLGAAIVGPAVLTFEYEPTPRALAIPLVMCAIGLTAQRRFVWSGFAAAAALLYHPPSVLPFLAVLALLRKGRALVIPAAAAVLLAIAAQPDVDARPLFGSLTHLDEELLRARAGYVWISAWGWRVIAHWLLLAAAALAAWLRVRGALAPELRVLSIGLPLIGIVSMPVSWLLLERSKLALAPQLQPMRSLLFVALMAQFLCGVAAVRAALKRRSGEAFVWFLAAFVLPIQPVLTMPWTWRRTVLLLALAALASVLARIRAAALAGAAAFFAIPVLGGVVNYPRLHTLELEQVAHWAQASTPLDTVFLFADAGKGLEPGVFRAEALRAVYVDWKSGGQLVYLRDFGPEWWSRWQQTAGAGFRSTDLPRYRALGIGYVVLRRPNPLDAAPAYENSAYIVYRLAP
jgi:hypothetical protein